MMSHLREVLPAGAQVAQATRWRNGQWQAEHSDALAQEVAVALVVNGIAHTVMMATPPTCRTLRWALPSPKA